MSFLKRLLETVMPLPVQAAGKAASAAREGVNAAGGGLEPQSMPGLAIGSRGTSASAPSGINAAGGGLSVESMPGLSFYGQGSLKNKMRMSGNTGQQAIYGQPQHGLGPQVQGVGDLNLHGNVQGGANNTHWQNFSGFPKNYVNPQVQDDGYYYL